MKKRFIKFFVVTILCISMITMTALAAESSTDTPEYSADMQELINELPNDAVVLYHDDEIILYQSKGDEGKAPEVMPLADIDYGYAWVSGSTTAVGGSFQVTKTFAGTGHITFKAESNDNSAWANMTIYRDSAMRLPITTARVNANAGDVILQSVVGTQQTYTVGYEAYPTRAGMRLMCWIYK